MPVLSKRLVNCRQNAIRVACTCSFFGVGSLPADAELHIVDVGGSQLAFDPQFLTLAPGDTVAFINKGGIHNVVADNNEFRCANGCDNDGANGNGALSNDNWVAVVEFPDSGTFGYFCEAHGQPGQVMYGAVLVQTNGTQGEVPGSAVPATSAPLDIGLLCALVLTASMFLRRRTL